MTLVLRAPDQSSREAALAFGSPVATLFQERARNQLTYWGRAKRACLLAAWIAGEAIESIERRFTVNPYGSATDAGDVRGIADTARSHLRSAYAIAQIAAPAEAPDPEAMDRLLRQLESGLPADVLDLLALPIPLARGEYLALAAAGLRTVTTVWSAAPAQLVGILGDARARDLIACRQGATPVATRTTDAGVARRQAGAA